MLQMSSLTRAQTPHSAQSNNTEPSPHSTNDLQLPSNVGAIRSPLDAGLDYAYRKDDAQAQQCHYPPSATWETHSTDKSEDSQSGLYGEVNHADTHARALGKQVKSAKRVRAKRQRLTENMKDLECRRRNAHVRLEASTARLDADIREHVVLSSTLEKLESLIADREREVSVVVHRIDSQFDTVNRIKMDCQAYEQEIKKMEAEFSSSGKQLQGIVQALDIFR